MFRHARAWRIGLLAWVAGAVDTFGYLALDKIFVGHVTGNASVLAISLVQRNAAEAFHRGWAIPAFFAGSMVGAVLVENARNDGEVRRALTLEAALLIAFVAVGWTAHLDLRQSGMGWALMVVLLGSAAGIQNAALTRPDTRGTHTTHVTGAVTDLAVEVVRALQPTEHAPHERTIVLASRLLGFFAGGLVGALLFQAMPTAGPLVPAAVLLAFAAIGL